MMATRIADPALCDLVTRMLVANGLSFASVGGALRLSPATVADLEQRLVMPLMSEEHERLMLFCAIMVQLEIRLGFDARAVRQMLDTPQAALGDRTPLVAMAEGLDGLREVHRLAGEMAVPATRWWRMAPTGEGTRALGRRSAPPGKTKISRRADTSDEDSLMTDTFDTTDRAHRLLTDMLRRANGGSDPALVHLTVGDTALPADADEIGDRRQRLHVTAGSSSRFAAAVGIATHWKMLWSRDLAFCVAPSGLFFLQSFNTPPLYAWVEDDCFLLDRGSLLPTAAQRLEAMAAFDADFAALTAEAL